MGRARRAKEPENSYIGIMIIVFIIVIVVAAVIIFSRSKEQDGENKIENNNSQAAQNTGIIENIAAENISNMEADTNQVVENTVQETENSMQNEATQPKTIQTEEINTSSAPAQPGVTDEKQKAIELVKKEWGNDDTVNYVFDYVNENGEYVIAVKDKQSATTKYYFRVNLKTGTVELD